MKQEIKITYETYRDGEGLPAADAELLRKAREIVSKAYAPYSHFCVSAAGRMENGQLVFGTNQENASYPVTICAERVLLANAAMQFAGLKLVSVAITYRNDIAGKKDGHPISPCGMCRQALLEFETRYGSPVRIIMGGTEGEVYAVESAKALLPLSFSGKELL